MLGKGSGPKIHSFESSFYLFSAASIKVHSALLKLTNCVLFLPDSDIYVRSFSITFTFIKFLLYKALSDWHGISLFWYLMFSFWRPWIHCYHSLFTVHINYHLLSCGLATAVICILFFFSPTRSVLLNSHPYHTFPLSHSLKTLQLSQ